jgi:predicted DNA-binding protein (MmcQ/YjbR family)
MRPERLERLRSICLALPGAIEQEAWGDPTWRVRNRIFAMQKGNYEGGRPSVWFKAAPGGQAVLVGSAPERFFVPPYVGHRGWVGLWLDAPDVDWEELADLVEDSYGLIARATKRAPAPASPRVRP